MKTAPISAWQASTVQRSQAALPLPAPAPAASSTDDHPSGLAISRRRITVAWATKAGMPRGTVQLRSVAGRTTPFLPSR